MSFSISRITRTFQNEQSLRSLPGRYTRQISHPLLEYDPCALKYIDLIDLEYFECEYTQAPVPRNQDLPKEAKTILTERSILVSTSHAWFYQSHPDPEGTKLNLIKFKFAPYLRKQYPNTKIAVFDDWHSCPQWPRKSQAEEDRFRKAMDHMNSMYCYCDVVLFLEAKLPDLDMRVRTCNLVPSEYDWTFFIDVIQFACSSSSTKKCEISKGDIIVAVDGDNAFEDRSEGPIEFHLTIADGSLLNVSLLQFVWQQQAYPSLRMLLFQTMNLCVVKSCDGVNSSEMLRREKKKIRVQSKK